MFVDNGYFPNIGNRTFIRWDELLQLHQRTDTFCSGGLGVSRGHLKPEKLFWYPIKQGWTYGRPKMIVSDNAGDIYVAKIDGEQVAIGKLTI